MKAFESLKYFLFTLVPIEKAKNFRALRFWSKTLSRKCWSTLKAYSSHRKNKTKLYNLALIERNKRIKQALVFKLMKVG